VDTILTVSASSHLSGELQLPAVGSAVVAVAARIACLATATAAYSPHKAAHQHERPRLAEAARALLGGNRVGGGCACKTVAEDPPRSRFVRSTTIGNSPLRVATGDLMGCVRRPILDDASLAGTQTRTPASVWTCRW
jgi:hypothetical protein